ATTAISTLSLHDALPIYEQPVEIDRDPLPWPGDAVALHQRQTQVGIHRCATHLDHDVTDPLALRQLETLEDRRLAADRRLGALRSEEHTSELQSRFDLVC